MIHPGADELDIERLRPLFQDAFRRAWRGEIENDDLNRLTLLAGLGWREVSVLRAYAKHMKQAAFTYSQAYMEQTLSAYPGWRASSCICSCNASTPRARTTATPAAPRWSPKSKRPSTRWPTSTKTASCASSSP